MADIHELSRGILDTDTYKLYMGHFYREKFPEAYATFEFINRDKNSLKFPPDFGKQLEDLVGQMPELTAKDEEWRYLEQLAPYLTPDYFSHFTQFRFEPNYVEVDQYQTEISLKVQGPAQDVTYFEVPLMYMIVELHNKMHGLTPNSSWEQQTRNALRQLGNAGVPYALFGTRRRFSPDVEDRLTELAVEENQGNFLSTSNIHFAAKYGIPFGGTNPHELYQAHSAVYGYEEANAMALRNWYDVYGTNLQTALTDTFTTDVFLRDYKKLMQEHPEVASVFRRFREDSSNPPEAYVDKIAAFLDMEGLDTSTYTIFHSNSLDVDRAIRLVEYDRTKGMESAVGIGTYLSHTLTGHPGRNIVIKLVQFGNPGNIKNVVKLSDEPGKSSGNPDEVKWAKRILGISG